MKVVRRAGRASVLTIVAIVAAVAAVALFFLPGEGSSTTATRFMSALASGDTATLTELSYMGETPKEEIRKKWDYTMSVAGNYRFYWDMDGLVRVNETEAGARVKIYHGTPKPVQFRDERFTLPLVKVDNRWLVDVRSINRTMFPALPR
jgi:hypothetical protein